MSCEAHDCPHNIDSLISASLYFGRVLFDMGKTPAEAELEYDLHKPYDDRCPVYPFYHYYVCNGYFARKREKHEG